MFAVLDATIERCGAFFSCQKHLVRHLRVCCSEYRWLLSDTNVKELCGRAKKNTKRAAIYCVDNPPQELVHPKEKFQPKQSHEEVSTESEHSSAPRSVLLLENETLFPYFFVRVTVPEM